MTPTIGTPLLWIGFTLAVLVILAVDLGLFHRHAQEVSYRQAILWTIVWTVLALCFNGFLFLRFGRQSGLEFLAGYLIEYSLSADNVFVFLLIFGYFRIPAGSQYRTLFWGVLGAMVMRAAFIFLGAAMLQRFHWVIYMFGAFLVYTGVRMFHSGPMEFHPERNPVVGWFRKLVPISSEYADSRFVVRQAGRMLATPLLLALVALEVMDLIFAVDSIPAVLAITRDPFIVFTSNICAILGLRSLYILLAAAMARFRYLTSGIGGVLCLVGFKMLLSDEYQFPTGATLAVIGAMLALSVLSSAMRRSADEDLSKTDSPSGPENSAR